jgi:hypothetical protein
MILGGAIAFLKKAIALSCNDFRECDRSLKKSDRTLCVIIVGRAIAVSKKAIALYS